MLKAASQPALSSPEKNAMVDSQAAMSLVSCWPVWERSGPASPLRCFFAVPPLRFQIAVDRSFRTIVVIEQAGGDESFVSGVTAISLGRSSRPSVLIVTLGAPASPSAATVAAT